MNTLSRTNIFAFALAAALMVGAFAIEAFGAEHSACTSREKVLQALDDVYSEQPISIGLTDAGSVIEVMASTEGSFTIVITHPNGLTCPVAAGTAWQNVAAKLKGLGT